MSNVMTVCGEVDASSLGRVLTHEHVFQDTVKDFRMAGLLSDYPTMKQELIFYREANGGTIVDLTNWNLGAQPEQLRRIAEETEVNIIAGTGLYRRSYYDRTPWLDRTSTNQVAEKIIRDIEDGIAGTTVRAGIIGEIGCEDYISSAEERSFRAAARAQVHTGAALNTHAARYDVAHDQLDLLTEEGVDPNRVIVSHCDTVVKAEWTTVEEISAYHASIAARGAYVEFDSYFRRDPDYYLARNIDYVVNMISAGYLDRLLLSHDTYNRFNLKSVGGEGYTFLFEKVVPRLQDRGVTDEQIHRIFVDNPYRALTGESAW